jgi:serine/threonine-protein kinase
LIGKTISHYKILERIGGGGMGVVYKAQDLKLDRSVALKFLPPAFATDPTTKERFIHEAKAASSLQHNNICAIHEIDETDDGQMYIVMDCYEGETLKKKLENGKLDVDDAIDITIQIAEGLQKAHKKGIIHRDIKPANVKITEDGVAKLLDFGLAKLPKGTVVTEEKSTLGTTHYMSPEIIEGRDVDHKTDIWSLGVLFYELVTGELPFKGDYESAIMYAILNESFEPITQVVGEVSEELDRIIGKCLQKNPEDRYQHVDDLIVDLRRVKRDSESKITPSQKDSLNKKLTKSKKPLLLSIFLLSTAIIVVVGYFLINQIILEDKPESVLQGQDQWENSIAVLPFDDLSPEGDQEWFCDGMTEQIITNLSKIKRLKVIGRTSVMKFKNTEKTLPEIGKELNVSHILEGSIRKYGESIRVTAQLINTEDGSHLWADDFDRELEHVFEVQDDVSQAIASILLATFSPQEQMEIKTNRPINTEAYEYYLKGKSYYNKGIEQDIKKAIGYFERAIKIDSTYARGYAGIALAYSVLGNYHILEPILCWQKMQNATEKALIFDNENALVKVFYEYNWQGAEKDFKHAIELNPNNSDIRRGYSHFLIAMRRFPEALIQIEHGLKLDPYSMVMLHNYVRCMQFSGQTEKSIMIAENAIVQDSVQVNPIWYWILAHGRSYQGEYESAVELTHIQIKLMGDDISDEIAFLGELYAKMGLKKKVQEVFENLNELSNNGKYISPIARAHIYLSLGDIDKAMELIEDGYNKRDGWMPWITVKPVYDLIRNDPRFISLTKKMGFK